MAEPVRRAGPGRGRTGALRTANAVEFGSEKTGTGLLKSLLLTGSCQNSGSLNSASLKVKTTIVKTVKLSLSLSEVVHLKSLWRGQF